MFLGDIGSLQDLLDSCQSIIDVIRRVEFLSDELELAALFRDFYQALALFKRYGLFAREKILRLLVEMSVCRILNCRDSDTDSCPRAIECLRGLSEIIDGMKVGAGFPVESEQQNTQHDNHAEHYDQDESSFFCSVRSHHFSTDANVCAFFAD